MSESAKPALGKRSGAFPRSKAYYKLSQASKKRKFGGRLRLLCVGVQGILITTGDKEKICVPEAYNLLNEYGDELYGEEKEEEEDLSGSETPSHTHHHHGNSGSEGDTSTKDDNDEEKATTTSADSSAPPPTRGMADSVGEGQRERRFSAMNSGAKHVIFIRCSAEVDPTELVHSMLTDINNTKVMKSRYCQRILPVVKVCHASLEEIRKGAEEVLAPHFHTNTTDSHSFAVNYKSRNNSSIKREDVIRVVAGAVTKEDQYPHRVDFNSPDLVIIVEIIKSLCCLSVVRDFFTLRKYNIQSLTAEPETSADKNQPKNITKATTSHSGTKNGKTSQIGTITDAGTEEVQTTDTGTEGKSKTQTETIADTGTEAKLESQTESKTDTGTEGELESGTRTELEQCLLPGGSEIAQRQSPQHKGSSLELGTESEKTVISNTDTGTKTSSPSSITEPPPKTSKCLHVTDCDIMSGMLSHELGYLARRELALILDHESPQGRDWMGLADQMGFTFSTILTLKSERSPTLALLDQWERVVGPEASIATLIELLDSLKCGQAVSILQREREKSKERKLELRRPVATKAETSAETSAASLNGIDLDRLKLEDSGVSPAGLEGDVIRETPSGRLNGSRLQEEKEAKRRDGRKSREDVESQLHHVRSQKYDVFLSFAEEDAEFAEEMRRRLVSEAKLRVFVPSDGLMTGKVFHREIADMIKKGCRKTVVILSPDYLSSPWCNYEANLALVASPDAGKHILIPVLYRRCEIPAFLSTLYYSDYPRHQGNRDECEKYFWQKLYQSLNYVPSQTSKSRR